MTAEVTLIQPDTAWKIGDGGGLQRKREDQAGQSSLNRTPHIRFANRMQGRESAGLSAGVDWPSGQLT